jgi:hypothetical protein
VKFLLTRRSLRAAGPCGRYAVRIDDLIPSEGATVAQILAAVHIPTEDRHWALCYAVGATDRILREHACWCARQSLEAERASGQEPDPRSWAAVEVAERFARDEATWAELSAAWADAWSYAWGAADAARDGAYSAARAAALAAARSYACAAARADDAAWAAAWERQILDLANRLIREES